MILLLFSECEALRSMRERRQRKMENSQKRENSYFYPKKKMYSTKNYTAYRNIAAYVSINAIFLFSTFGNICRYIVASWRYERTEEEKKNIYHVIEHTDHTRNYIINEMFHCIFTATNNRFYIIIDHSFYPPAWLIIGLGILCKH